MPSTPVPQAPGVPGAPQLPGTPPPATTLPIDRVFASDSGLIINPIRSDKVVDFEMVMAKVHEALSRSTDPVRRKQAAGWKIFKAAEQGPNASVLYVFAMDPAVSGADYTVSKILSEAFPTEARDLWRIYTAAFAGAPSLVNMRVLEDLGKPYVPKPAGQKPLVVIQPTTKPASPATASPALPATTPQPPSTPPPSTQPPPTR
jgi:hypothetical protein